MKCMAERRFENDWDLIKNSMFFDEQWYLNNNRDVAAANLDAATHYLQFGAQEGRDPSPFFDTKQYYSMCPDASSSNINPLVHFLRYTITTIGCDFNKLGVNLLGAVSYKKSFDIEKSGTKALFVTHDLNYGGAPHVLANIVRWFQKHTDYDAYVISMSGGPLVSIFDPIAPLHVVGNKLLVEENDIFRASEEVRKFLGAEPAFIFINSAAAGGFCDINPFRSPVFGYIHEMPKVLNLFQGQYRKLLFNAKHMLVGYTEKLVKDLDLKDCSYRPAFINVSDSNTYLTRGDKSNLRKALGWDAETPVVMGCGVLDWRKQPDLFVRAAKKLVLDRQRNVRFIWCGGGEELDRVQKLAVDLGVADRVEFLGYRDDFGALVEAADVFALCSIEDPFPLVCLQAAAASVPSVIFREATGMIDLVEPDGGPPAGLAVTLGDEEAYFDALDSLVSNNDRRDELAQSARASVLKHYTTPNACREILKIIRERADISPKVSIVVPSYNCAKYLSQRLESIASQTFQDIEIILIDDASIDGSQEILQKFSNTRPDVQVFLETQNSGSVFKAWRRGIEKASGDFIWIAEADDFCESDFLARLVSHMSKPGVNLVHGRSIPVDSDNNISGDWNDLYLDKVVPGRWHKSFTSPAFKEVNTSLGRANIIPNVSAVLVRRSAALKAIEIAVDYKLAGDWAFYLHSASGGMVAYCHEAVNFHRRHHQSVTSSIEGSPLYFQELANVGRLVETIYGPNKLRSDGFASHMTSEARRFGYNQDLPVGILPKNVPAVRRPGLLFGIGDLSGGGAQMFAVRLVNEWRLSGASVVLLVAGHDQEHPATRAKISGDVPIVGIEEVEAAGGLAQFMSDWGLDVIFTGHWWADRCVAQWKANGNVAQPWAIIMHGCYESVLANQDYFPGFREDFARAEEYCDCWIWTAPKNKLVFEQKYISPKQIAHIVNGFRPISPGISDRTQLGLPNEALIFTLASRAIEEKGWLVALNAFKKLREKYAGLYDIRLLLIGDGPIMDHLQATENFEGLHLVRHTSQLSDYIFASDVCLLPSWFVGESLPLTVIEFLAQGKPAIVSNIGSCPWSISYGDEIAGLVVDRDEAGKINEDSLGTAMEVFVQDKDMLVSRGAVGRRAFEKFDMDVMMHKYLQLAVKLVEKS